MWLYPRLTSWMGGVRFIYEVMIRFAKKYDVLLIVQRQDSAVTELFVRANIPVICLNTPSFTEIAFWLNFGRTINKNISIIKRNLRAGDILISSMFPMNVVADGLPNYHIQIIYEPFAMFHDKIYQRSHSYPVFVFSKFVSEIFRKTDADAVNKSDLVLTLSNYERKNILQIYGRNSEIIYEGVDIGYFYPKPDPLLEDKYKDKHVIFHSTGYDSFKGTDLVIESVPLIVKRIENVVFLISHTRVNRAKLNKYSRFLEKNRIDNKVEFLGFVDYKMLPAYYTLADIYVEPGYGRSMSLSSKEANACGTPSIRGNIGTEDTINGETGFLVSPFDKNEFSERIVQSLLDKKLCKKLGENARQVVLKNFTWDKVVSNIIKHFPTDFMED